MRKRSENQKLDVDDADHKHASSAVDCPVDVSHYLTEIVSLDGKIMFSTK